MEGGGIYVRCLENPTTGLSVPDRRNRDLLAKW